MAVLILPSEPPPAAMTIGKVSAANTLTPAIGGADLELLRKGTRYLLTFLMPSMSYVVGLDWSDLMIEGATVVMEVHQPGLDVGAPPAPLVKGAGQAGSLISLDGLGAGYTIRKGQFLSIITGGQRFLYRAAVTTVANGAGEALLPLQTMLRRSPADNDVVEVVTPKIEGYVRDLGEWTVGLDHEVGIKFSVRERE